MICAYHHTPDSIPSLSVAMAPHTTEAGTMHVLCVLFLLPWHSPRSPPTSDQQKPQNTEGLPPELRSLQ